VRCVMAQILRFAQDDRAKRWNQIHPSPLAKPLPITYNNSYKEVTFSLMPLISYHQTSKE
jgi:hypothetical protein